MAAQERRQQKDKEVEEQRMAAMTDDGRTHYDTLYALVDGTVQFHKGKRDKSVVSVVPNAEA